MVHQINLTGFICECNDESGSPAVVSDRDVARTIFPCLIGFVSLYHNRRGIKINPVADNLVPNVWQKLAILNR